MIVTNVEASISNYPLYSLTANTQEDDNKTTKADLNPVKEINDTARGTMVDVSA